MSRVPSAPVRSDTYSIPRPTDLYDIYKQVTLKIPVLNGMTTMFDDRIRSTPSVASGISSKLPQDANFDTILAKTPGRSRLKFRVGRVRVLFQSAALAQYFGATPLLAYVEWYTDIKPNRSPARMYEVQKAFSRDGRRLVDVIPVSDIIRSCHLIPRWDKDLETPIPFVLDHFDDFRVNDFLDMHSYLSL